MHIDRRALRKSLGSRTHRRNGTKTKVMRGSKGGGKGASPKYRYPRHMKTRPAVLLAQKVRKAEADAAKAA